MGAKSVDLNRKRTALQLAWEILELRKSLHTLEKGPFLSNSSDQALHTYFYDGIDIRERAYTSFELS